jgi:hypothetical protein
MAATPPGGSAFDALSKLTDTLGAGATAVAGTISTMEGTLKKLIGAAGKYYSYWEKVNTSTLNITKNFGGTLKSFSTANSYTRLLSSNLQEAGSELERMGSSIAKSAEAIGKLSDNSGTFVGVTTEAIKGFAALSEKIGDATAGDLAKDLISVGYSLESSNEVVAQMVDSSQKMGLNSKKVSEAVSSNFKALSRYTFKGGATEMASMAQSSVMLGVNMGEATKKLKDLRSPEKAIEFAQQMQMYGGTIAQELGDANEILRMSHSGAEGLKEYNLKLAKSAASLMTNVDGTFQLIGGNQEIMDGLIEKSQMTADQFQDMAQKMAKLTELSGKYNLNLPTEDLNVLQGFIDFSKSSGGKIQLTGVDKLDEQFKKDRGIDSKGMIDANNITSENMGELVKALKESTKEKESKEPKDAVQGIKDQVTASINLTDQLSRLGGQIIALTPNVATLANNSKVNTDIKEGMSSIKKILEDTKSKEAATGLIDKGIKGFETVTTTLNTSLSIIAEKIATGGFTFTTAVTAMEKIVTKFLDIKAKGGMVEYGDGGLFNGPSHKQGGIPVTTKGSGNMFEVEGGEAIINKKSTSMFKPLLSSINELGGGVKFANGGISSPMASRSTQMGSNGTSNINVGSSTPININVNVNGSVAIDGKNFNISDEEKEKLSISIKNTFMSEVFSNITKGEAFTGKKTKPNYIFNS